MHTLMLMFAFSGVIVSAFEYVFFCGECVHTKWEPMFPHCSTSNHWTQMVMMLCDTFVDGNIGIVFVFVIIPGHLTRLHRLS